MDNVVKLSIDNKEYLFRLTSLKDIPRLKELAGQLERKIQKNKKSLISNDYNKVLILTCLNLLEEITLIKQNHNSSRETYDKQEKEILLSRLVDIKIILQKIF
jgi:cell division protein ZapA (FtsZ GTPase activity inhibitor)